MTRHNLYTPRSILTIFLNRALYLIDHHFCVDSEVNIRIKSKVVLQVQVLIDLNQVFGIAHCTLVDEHKLE